MVEINLVDEAAAGADPASKKLANGSSPLSEKPTGSSADLLSEDKIDSELVGKLRQLIKEECDGKEEKYSARHYEDLMDESSMHTCWRYLVHCNLDLKETFDLVKSSLAWRKENQACEQLGPNEVAKEFWLLAPLIMSGKTRDGDEILYVVGKNYRRPGAPLRNSIRRFTTRILFDFDQKHARDFQQLMVIFDVSNTGFRNFDLDFMAWVVSIRDFVPARFSQIQVLGIPFLVRPLVRLIISWLPEKFSRLVSCGTFEQLVAPQVEPNQLPVELDKSTVEHETYRLAPVDVPWAADSPIYSDESMQKALEDSVGFCFSKERRERLIQMQLDYESKLNQK